MSIDLSAALAARFKPVEKDTSPGIVIELWGPPGSGKTDFAMRAPGPVMVFGFDYHGTKRPVNRLIGAYPDRMKRVIPRTYSTKPRDRKSEADEVASRQMREEVLLPFIEDFEYAVDNGVRSVVIDTLDMLKSVQVIAKFGKLEANSQLGYQEINAETARLVHMAREKDMVLILLTRMKEEYKETLVGGKAVSKATGKLVKASNVATTHAVDASLEMLDGFKLKIVDAKTNKASNGTVLDSPEFAQVCNLLKPDVEYEAWE